MTMLEGTKSKSRGNDVVQRKQLTAAPAEQGRKVVGVS